MTAPAIHDASRRKGLGNWNQLREQRKGVMLHFDASASDSGAVAWLIRDPACKVSYNWLVLDDGAVQHVAPHNARAWHAGNCSPSSSLLRYNDANSAFYGLAVAAKPGDTITDAQRAAVIDLCLTIFQSEGWPVTDDWRITSHHLEAWPRGRKSDIEGVKGFSLEGVRAGVAQLAASRRTV